MVNASELRLGNHLLYKGKIIVVNEISGNYINQDTSGNSENYDLIDIEDIEPIRLTEEILTKCGMVVNERYRASYLGGFCVSYFDGLRPPNWDVYFRGKSIKGIDFLHEWENLYFFLTDKELETKL